jgi:hypothetical protein
MKSHAEIAVARQLLFDLVEGNLPIKSATRTDLKLSTATMLALDWVLDLEPNASILEANLNDLLGRLEAIASEEQMVVEE